MKTLKISRFEGIYAICEDEDRKFFAIERPELPEGAKTGDLLKVDDEAGVLSLDRKPDGQKARGKS